MSKKGLTIDEVLSTLINGETVWGLTPEQEKEVQKRLREIKKNCTIVLRQLKDKTL